MEQTFGNVLKCHFKIVIYSLLLHLNIGKTSQNGQRGNIYKYKHIEHIYGA